MPSVEVIGVHSIPLSEELLRAAYEARHEGSELSDTARVEAERVIRDELSSTVLVELWVRDRDRCLFAGDFGQSEGDRVQPDDAVAYDEHFLSDDGVQVIGHSLDRVETGDVRWAFFLHGYDLARPILTSYGPVDAPAPTPMPARLDRMVRYRPVA